MRRRTLIVAVTPVLAAAAVLVGIAWTGSSERAEDDASGRASPRDPAASSSSRPGRDGDEAAVEVVAGPPIPPRDPSVPAEYGLRLLPPDGVRPAGALLEPVAGTADEAWPRQLVVLVHGLDDPGWIWQDLAPALADADFRVAELHYPNDGPIAAAADLFASELARIASAGVERIDVVAHSMGGLVTRDVLTRPAYYGGRADGGGDGRLPVVGTFVMCGTPNHGSVMARFQGIAELRDQVSRFARGDGVWGGHRLDGQGEAGRDLLPGSDFLEALNARPLARGVRHVIIAGRVSPLGGEDAGALARRLQDFAERAGAPPWLRDAMEGVDADAEMAVGRVVRGVGDGLVTLDSARLEGVDDVTVVDANHASMVWTIVPGSDAVPPAIPIIIDRLRGGGTSRGTADSPPDDAAGKGDGEGDADAPAGPSPNG